MIARVSLVLILAILVVGPFICRIDPIAQDRNRAGVRPSGEHWLGTDDYGRDLGSRFLSGGRWSVLTSVTSTCIALLLGWTAGAAAGMSGGVVDATVMTVSEWFLAVPWIYLLIAARSAMPLDLAPRKAMAIIAVLIALLNWARPARLARGLILSLSQKKYVEAARALGVPEWRIMLRHILPSTGGIILAQGLALFPRFMIADVTLSFLGLGAGEPYASWGSLILPLKQIYILNVRWWMALPAALMIPLFASVALVGRDFEKRYRISR
jgi:peptide/nickel transport system permease protein